MKYRKWANQAKYYLKQELRQKYILMQFSVQ